MIRRRDPHEVPTTSHRQGSGQRQLRGNREPAAQLLFDQLLLVTGGVPGPGYEPGIPRQTSRYGSAAAREPDPLVLDERALIVDIKDKGLLVIAGCGHAGIVNICRYARRLTNERPLYTMIGRLHLSGPIFSRSSPGSWTTLAH